MHQRIVHLLEQMLSQYTIEHLLVDVQDPKVYFEVWGMVY